MSDYRDERIALEKRATELETEKRSLESEIASSDAEILHLEIALSQSAVPKDKPRGLLYVFAGLVVAAGVALVVVRALTPGPVPVSECPATKPEAVRSLVLWATVSEASTPGDVGKRCKIRLDTVGLTGSLGAIQAATVICDGDLVYKEPPDQPHEMYEAADLRLTPIDARTFGVSYSQSDNGRSARIDTTRGTAKITRSQRGPSQTWDLSLDGPAAVRAANADR